MSTPERHLCKGCNLPMPAEWCWENKLLDCWFGCPPRNINQHAVLGLLRDLTERVTTLEEERYER